VIWRICASGYLKRESIHEGLISAWDTIATLNSGARLDRPGRTAGSSRPLRQAGRLRDGKSLAI
jgi:hypothetical protein